MKTIFWYLCVVFSIQSVTSQISLEQFGNGIVKPTEELSLTCKVTGASLTDSSKIWSVLWVREAMGKGLEWLGGIWHDAIARYAQSMQGRLTVSRDTNKGEVYFKLTGMKTEESSTYYCTTESTGGAFDYWGKGTFVTVTSVEKSSGNVFPLVPCCEMPNIDHIHIGCLYYDVFPHPGPFIWEALPSTPLTSYDFPHALVKDKYSFVSYIVIPSNDWDSKTYTCTPSQKSKETKSNTLGKTLKKKVCEKKSPILKISLTSCAGDTEDNMVYLVCTVFNFPSGHGEVTWLQNGKNYVRTGNSIAKAKDMVFMLNVSKESWNKEDEYTCQLQYQNEIKMENISKCLACYSSFMKPTVVSSKPSIEDILNNKIEISCSVHNININPGTKQVFLKVDGQQFGKVAREELTKNSIKATFTMTREEWDKMETVSCLVKQPCSGSDIEEVVKINLTNRKTPTVSANRTMFLDEGGIAAVCKASGFYPDEISIHWEKENQKMEAGNYINSPVTCSGSTCFTMSFLKASKQDNLASYKCVVYHLSLNSPQKMDIEDISETPLSEPLAQILKPSFKDLFIYKTANISCRTNAPKTNITWLADGNQIEAETDEELSQLNNTTLWFQSTLKVPMENWKKTSNFTCILNYHQNSAQKTLNIQTKQRDLQAPIVQLLMSTPEDVTVKNQLMLLCLVKDFYPEELFVAWRVLNITTQEDNPQPITIQEDNPQPNVVKCHHQSKHCSYISELSIEKEAWLSGAVYTCEVAHLSSEDYITKSINFKSGTTSTYILEICDPREGEDLSDVEDANNVWPTASTFIALFLLTLIYSSFVTFIKVK